MEFKNKRVLVVGLGKSGFSAAKLLKKLGAQVWVSDCQASSQIEILAFELSKEGVLVETGQHTPAFTEAKDLIVISPGVSSHLPFLEKAKVEGTPIISEIELGYELCPSPIIAITGTNGKTTVATLIGRVLDKHAIANVVCGNIGHPFTQELNKLDKDSFVVLETSSFQLENINQFRPYIALVLNIWPDHLDRYLSLDDYIQAKENLFRNQTPSDFAILNYRDTVVRGFEHKTKAKVVFFNQTEEPNEKLNENQKAVLALGSVLGISQEVIFSVFNDFPGLEHRYELVRELAGVKFINDSKATNVQATIYALNLSPEKVILIAGGRDKGQDFQPIGEWLGQKVKYLFLIGEAQDKIEKVADNFVPLMRCSSLEEATRNAFAIAQRGDLILFSPMCASFDMFANYEERGRVFKNAVMNLKKDKVFQNA